MKKFRTLEAYFEEWEAKGREDMYHEFIWYVNVPLTFEQWMKLDDAMGDAFEAAGINLDEVVGVAGPIPFPPKDEEETDDDE